MTELLALKGTERVLEIGTGSGYQAAILAELAKEVYTIEILEPLARQSEGLLKELNYKNIKVKFGDGFLGWPEFSPFDGIIVTCAPEKIPPPLLEQLAEGGRLVIPVGVHWQDLKLVRKIKGRIEETDISREICSHAEREVNCQRKSIIEALPETKASGNSDRDPFL